MATTASAPGNSLGVGPRVRRTKRRAPVPLPGPWRDSSWVHSFSSQGPSPLGNPQDLNPAFALRKIVLLLEKHKFLDVSQLINQLNNVIIKSILHEIPVGLFIENIPESLVALESLYSKLFILDPENFPIDKLAVEAMVLQIVRYLALQDSMLDQGIHRADEEAMKSITNILQIVLFVNPDIVSVVHARKKMIDNALRGIGEHGLVQVTGSLMNLHDGLKVEFEKTTLSYKTAMQQLEQLSLSHAKPVTLKSFANRSLPSANHQVLMTYTEAEIQDRLFKNKTVLNAVESNMNNQLPHLIQTLKDRIENDKNALLAFGKLRREIKAISAEAKVAPVLTQYSRSLTLVLEKFRKLLDAQFPEKSSKPLVLADQDEQVLKLEEVEGTPREVEDNAPEKQNEKNSADLSDSDIPPPPSQPPPPIPTSIPDDKDVEPPSPKEEVRRRGRSRERSRARRQLGTSSQRKKGNKSRATSLDRSQVVISRPKRDSVEENRDFQMMMKRISSVSASSPAVGRRDLEKRGISPLRNGSRSVSVSPTSVRRQLMGESVPLSELTQRPMEREKAESRRSSESSVTDNLRPPPSGRRAVRPASMFVSSPQSGEDTNEVLVQERSQRENAEKERDRITRLYRVIQEQLEKTKEDLRIALDQIGRLQENEKKLNQKITKMSSHPALVDNTQGIIKSKNNIVGDLLYEYDKLYANDRAQAWMSLNVMSDQKQFEESDDLKDKVLFSVIVLAFRTVRNTLESIRGGVQQLLQVPYRSEGGNDVNHVGDNKVKEKTNTELLQFLRRLGDGYDLQPLVQDVGKQLYSALYDYPKLKTSLPLSNFMERCVSMAWRLMIQDTPLTITYDIMTFNPDVHQRAPGTNRKSSVVKSYLWPCLVEEHSGQCVYKGVVVT